MKKFVKILLGIIGVVTIAIVAIFFFTAGMVNSADEFFAAVKSKNMDKAYSYFSKDFQANTSKSNLESFLEKNLIHEFKEANWRSRSINNGRGSLIGSITTESGGVVPITLSFVKGENGWKIYSIQKPASGIQKETSSLQLPTEQEQVKLVTDAVLAFSESVNEKNMSTFHSHVSNLWQQQFTVEQFDETFGAFYAANLNLTILKNFTPTFNNKPSINKEGVMIISGYYPTKPDQFHFEQKYIYEGIGWKLLGFSVNIQ